MADETQITMPPAKVLERLASTLARRAGREFAEHEQVGPMSMSLKLASLAEGYTKAMEGK